MSIEQRRITRLKKKKIAKFQKLVKNKAAENKRKEDEEKKKEKPKKKE
jgi:hypothetical protein